MYFGLQSTCDFGTGTRRKEELYQMIFHAGYRRILPCVTFGKEKMETGWLTAEELLQSVPLLKEAGLSAEEIVVTEREINEFLPEICLLAEKTGLHFVAVSLPEPCSFSKLQKMADAYRAAAESLAGSGAMLLLRNRDEKWLRECEGTTELEVLLELCGTSVGTEIRLEAFAESCVDAEAFLWRNKKRVRSILYPAAVLSGLTEEEKKDSSIDWTSCFQFARANGIWQAVEQKDASFAEVKKAGTLLSAWTFFRDGTSSLLCTLDVDTGEETVLHRFPGVIEAPNWLNDGNTLLYNANGCMYRYRIDTDTIEEVNTGSCRNCNNDHVPSPDNRFLAVSCSPEGKEESHIYLLPMEGGEPEDITKEGFRYLHGWSPDGKELCYCALRKNPSEEKMRVEVCTIPVEGGEEVCLTDGLGYNDGPEYAPDGKHIWFNSTRSGLMQVYRMNRDGSGLEQMTDGEANNWFGHVSPDGRRVVYLTFTKGELEPDEHLPNMNVQLSIMNADGTKKRKLLDLFGGQGSINVNSWAPDSRRIAFVKYDLHHK